MTASTPSHPFAMCGGISRRRVLQIGGVGALNLGLADLLQARAPTAAAKGPPKSCIFIVQYGGASQIDTFDPKPDAPAEIRGPYKAIPTRVPGTRCSEKLPRLAGLADRLCLIRSMTHGTADHNNAMHVAMTGHSLPNEATPYYGSLAARLAPATRNIPAYVWLQNLAGDVRPHYLTGGHLGPAFAPLRVGNDLDNPSAPGFRVKAFQTPEGMSAQRLSARMKLLDEMEPPANHLTQTPGGVAVRRFQEKAVDLVTGPETRRAFDLDQENVKLRDRYGRHPLGQNLLMARRLVESGVRLVNVVAWTGVPDGVAFQNTQTWDMHGVEVLKCGIFDDNGSFSLGFALPRVDQAVSALIEDLEARGLLESTLVVMVGEFGRTPKISTPKYAGRDHWPHCYSAMLAGGGTRGGLTYGASDKLGGYVKEKPVTPEDFGATLLHALGIDPETRLGKDGFSLQASTGRVISELFEPPA